MKSGMLKKLFLSSVLAGSAFGVSAQEIDQGMTLDQCITHAVQNETGPGSARIVQESKGTSISAETGDRAVDVFYSNSLNPEQKFTIDVADMNGGGRANIQIPSTDVQQKGSLLSNAMDGNETKGVEASSVKILQAVRACMKPGGMG